MREARPDTASKCLLSDRIKSLAPNVQTDVEQAIALPAKIPGVFQEVSQAKLIHDINKLTLIAGMNLTLHL